MPLSYHNPPLMYRGRTHREGVRRSIAFHVHTKSTGNLVPGLLP